MSADYTNSRPSMGCVYPLYAIDAGANVNRYQPLITPEIFKKDYLFGISLKSPITGEVLNNEDLKRTLDYAMNRIETEIKINIFPVQRKVRKEYDKNLYQAYCYLEMPYRPILSVEELAIADATGTNIFVFPPTLIETGNFQTGLITLGYVTNVYTNSFFSANGVASPFGNWLLANVYPRFIPAFFSIKYTAGFPEDKMPGIINDLIATEAAIDLLSRLGPLVRTTSSSLGLDGMSQSIGSPGPNIYALRISDLKEKRDELIKNIRMMYYNSIMMSTF